MEIPPGVRTHAPPSPLPTALHPQDQEQKQASNASSKVHLGGTGGAVHCSTSYGQKSRTCLSRNRVQEKAKSSHQVLSTLGASSALLCFPASDTGESRADGLRHRRAPANSASLSPSFITCTELSESPDHLLLLSPDGSAAPLLVQILRLCNGGRSAAWLFFPRWFPGLPTFRSSLPLWSASLCPHPSTVVPHLVTVLRM